MLVNWCVLYRIAPVYESIDFLLVPRPVSSFFKSQSLASFADNRTLEIRETWCWVILLIRGKYVSFVDVSLCILAVQISLPEPCLHLFGSTMFDVFCYIPTIVSLAFAIPEVYHGSFDFNTLLEVSGCDDWRSACEHLTVIVVFLL